MTEGGLFGPSTYSAVVFVDDGGDAAAPPPAACPVASNGAANGAAPSNGCPAAAAASASPPPPRRGAHVRLPRQVDLPAVVGAVIAATRGAVGGDVRLFVEPAKAELTAAACAKQLAAAAGACDGLVVLIATRGGAGLSAAAAAAPPPAVVPAGPPPLPIVKNAPLLLKGDGDTPPERLASNLFGPAAIEAGRDTVAIQLPLRGAALAALVAEGGLDDAAVGATLVVTADPDIVGELCDRQDDFKKMWNRPQQKAVADFAGDGLFTSSTTSENWQTGHGLIPRAFNAFKIKAMFPVVLDAARELARELGAASSPTEPLPGVDNWLVAMTADAVVRVALGLDMKNVRRLGAGEPPHELLDCFAFGLKHAFGRTTVKDLKPDERPGPLSSTKAALDAKYKRCKAVCEKNVADLVEATRAGELAGVGGEPTLLASLLNDVSPATGKRCRLDVLYGHAINLMIAGHETTAATLGFTLAHLAASPEWEARCVEEVRTVLAGRAEPSYADLGRLPTLEACFKESLRLHPPVGSVARDAMVDTTLGGGRWLVRRGQTVMCNIYAVHRRPDVWGGEFGDVKEWNPARFMPGAADGRHRFAFMPFGFGVRSCAGQLFALMEAKTVLAVLLNAFVLRTRPGHKIRATTEGGGAAPTPADLAMYVQPRAGAPPLGERPPSAAAGAAAAAPAAVAAAAPAPAAAAAPAASSHGTPLRILYGSNGGTCEALASSLAEAASAAGFATTQAPLDAALTAATPDAPLLPADAGATAIITSTYNGHPPDNAKAFAKWLEAPAPAVDGAAKFAVFAVGNSQWAQTFLKFGKAVDAGLAAAGAARVRPLATADADGASLSEDFDDWVAALLPELAAAAGVRASDAPAAPSAAASAAAADAALRARLTALPAGTKTMSPIDVCRAFRAAGGDAAAKDPTLGYHVLPVTATTRLTPPSAERATAYVELALPAGLPYTPGDHLEVLAHNGAAAVDAALAALGLTGDEAFEWTPVGAAAERGPARGLAAVSRAMPPCPVSARDALAWLVDLAAPPPRRLVAALAARAACPPDAAGLAALATEAGYRADVAAPRTALIDLLQRFPSAAAGWTLHDFVNATPRLTPRYYSIASSPATPAGPTRVAACVGLVEYVTPSGRVHRGAGSGTVHDAKPGDALLGTVRALQSSFKLPADSRTPIVMVGPGTGVAPMVGFLEDRAATLAARGPGALGPAVLYFGCRCEDDFIFKRELAAWKDSGVLTRLRVALSRAPGEPKTYVQDLIAADAGDLWATYLSHPAAKVYICGDAKRMAPDVKRAFGRVAETVGGKASGAAFMDALVEEGRYLEDVWAG